MNYKFENPLLDIENISFKKNQSILDMGCNWDKQVIPLKKLA